MADDNDALLASAGSMDASVSPAIAGMPAQAPPISQQQPQQQPPKFGGRPLLLQYIQALAHGGQGTVQPGQAQPQRPVSRGDATLEFLGQFLANMSQGLAAAGHGPGANARGFAGAVQAPYQRDLQSYQLQQQQQQQQSQIQSQQAEAELKRAQAQSYGQTVMTPYGPMNQKLAEKVFPAAITAQARTTSAEITGGARVEAAQINQGQLMDVPKDLQARFHTPAQLPLNQLSKLQSVATKAPSEIGLIQLANKGDKDAADTLRVLQQRRGELASMRQSARGVEVLDFDKDGNAITRWMTVGDAIKGSMSGAVQGTKNLSRTQQLQDIQYSSTQLRKAIQNVEPFTPGQIAKMQVALTSNDERAISTQWGSLANDNLSSAQQDMVIWLKNINERALSLRNIAGQGQGAMDTRNAIRSLLPNLASGNKEMMFKQLDAFDNQTAILARGIPKPGNAKNNIPPANNSGGAKKYSTGNPFAQ